MIQHRAALTALWKHPTSGKAREALGTVKNITTETFDKTNVRYKCTPRRSKKTHTFSIHTKVPDWYNCLSSNTPKPREQGGDHTESPRQPYWHWKHPKQRLMLPRKCISKILENGKLQPDFGHAVRVQNDNNTMLWDNIGVGIKLAYIIVKCPSILGRNNSNFCVKNTA
jgi:hypothetical protein